MSDDRLLAGGDAAPHGHLLPKIPSVERTYTNVRGEPKKETVLLENAVARCPGCGQLFVSRYSNGEWSNGVYWTRLRWWHRTAKKKLRGAK